MADRKNTKLRAVKTNTEELEARIRAHRRKILKRSLIITIICALIIGGTWLYIEMRHYSEFEVLETTERADTAATKFTEYRGGILKYSNDGAFYTDLDDELIWNQTYEMLNPHVEICQDYAAIADINGSDLYIMNEAGMQGSVVTTMPIVGFCVASQGTTVVLLQTDGGYYLKLYDKTGQELASGELHEKNSGYPIAIALAPDAKKMAVSMLNISEGKAASVINFYNYGSVGQNEQDNIVATYTYSDMLISKMYFTDNDSMIAFGDSQVQIYQGAQKPELAHTLDLTEEVKSIFYDDSHFGLVYNNEDEANTRRMEVFDLRCAEVMTKDFDMDYSNIEFLSNNEICIRNEHECQIYNLYGINKFSYEFDTSLYKVIPQYLGIYYTFVVEGATEKVRLK